MCSHSCDAALLINIMLQVKAGLVSFLVLDLNHRMSRELCLSISLYKWQMPSSILGYIAPLVSGTQECIFKYFQAVIQKFRVTL